MEKLGLSGDTILIDGNHVIKICDTDQKRFLKNCLKQRAFNNSFVKSVPIIVQSITESNKNFIKMPLLKCSNAIEWLTISNVSDVKLFVNVINNYFSSIMQKSEIRDFDYKIWSDKIIDLQSKINDQDLVKILEFIKNIKFQNQFYYGDYHGDFTLSNLFIFKENDFITVDAIDFLESFIYSPLNDLVKIRQDTKHLWTLKLIQNKKGLDVNKVLILLNAIDDDINNIIKNDKILSEFYLPFQILNLMRIVPYNKEEKIFQYLKQEIEELFHEFNSNYALCRQIYKI